MINEYDFSNIVPPDKNTTITEDVEGLLSQFLYEANDKRVRADIIACLDFYFKRRMSRDSFTFTDETTNKDVENGRLTIMVDTPWINAGDNGRMLLGEFTQFATNLEIKKAFSKRFVRHSMELSLVVGRRLAKMGKEWSYIDELLGEGMASKIRAATVNITLRQISILEVALGIELFKHFGKNGKY